MTEVDLFEPVVPAGRLHPSFVGVASHRGHQAARRLMNEVFNAWPDADSHFVREFQTAGFDARTWELYLRAVLVDLGFEVDCVEDRPDFRCQFRGETVFVEATTANATGNPDPIANVDAYFDALPNAISDYDEIAIRFGSALRSKQQKHYETLPHVHGHPLILAVAPFYDPGALMKAENALLRYLFGLDLVQWDADGNVTYSEKRITQHRGASKVVPSAWFDQPGTEFISGVAFSNSGTQPKFNRLGFAAGYGDPKVLMSRVGYEFDPDPAAFVPRPFKEDVGDVPEPWSEGLVLIHNPNAVHAVHPDLFPDVHQIFLTVDGDLWEIRSPRRIFKQQTLIVAPRD